MITEEKEMKISQTYRTDLAPLGTKSALQAVTQRLGWTLLAFALVVGVTEAQQAAPPIEGVIGKLQSFDGKSLDVMTGSGEVHVAVKEPLTTHKQIPSDLSHITASSYVGVASTGAVSRPASHSRMTNGTVQKSGATTLVVHYQDGSQTISLPPNVPVTEVAPQKVTFSPGDVVYATTQKLPDGTLVTDKIFQFIPAESH